MHLASEESFLALIDGYFPTSNSHILLGRGDDCAVIQCPETLCLTSDLFLEDIHFRRSYFSPGDIGYKSLAVNISDIAAMGARPLGFNLNLMIPDGLEEGFWEDFFQAMSDLAAEAGLVLAGGDLSRSSCLGLDVTMWGQAPGRYLQRGQARPGDVLFLAGQAGLARVGLAVLEGGGDPAAYPEAVQAHLRPRLHCWEALELAGQSGVVGLMDVSDGLARDVPRFLGPGLGADLELGPEGIPEEVHRYCREQGISAEEQVFLGGEDYALLGAASEAAWPEVRQAVPGVRRIGQVRAVQDIRLSGRRVTEMGFDHFG